MIVDETVREFGRLYLGDSLMTHLHIDTGGARCRLTFHAGSVLARSDASIHEPTARYAPAVLTIEDVWEIAFLDGLYQLNSTVVDFQATASATANRIDYAFTLTGGSDPDAFLARIRISGGRFTFTPA